MLALLLEIALLTSCSDVSEARHTKAENTTRIAHAKRIISMVKSFAQKKDEKVDLYKAYVWRLENYKKTKLYAPSIVILPENADYWPIEDYVETPKKFYEYCQYRLVQLENGTWGIIELVHGAFGKYYILVTEDGIAYRISSPVLPEQKSRSFMKQANGKELLTFEGYKYPIGFSQLPTLTIKELIESGNAARDLKTVKGVRREMRRSNENNTD